MNARLWIKNNLWRSNYIIPLTTKYRMAGKKEFVQKALPLIFRTKVVRAASGKRSVAADTLELLKQTELRYDPTLRFYYHIDEKKTIAVKGNILGNFPLDYRKIIDGGFHELTAPAVKAGGRYGENAGIIRDAVDLFYIRIRRYLKDGGYTFAFQALEGLRERKALHFAEGLQRVLFFDQILWQTRHRLNGIGRIDRYLGELYEADIRDGYLYREEAYDLIKAFLKCLHKSYEYKSAALLGDVGQIIVLGGLTEEGEYFRNDLTEMFLQAHKELAFPDPKILLRVSRKMPEDMIDKLQDCLLGRTGSPILSNDDIVIDRLTGFGFSKEDACGYAVSACWEPFISGRSMDQNNILSFDLAKVLFDLLKKADLSKITSFRALLLAYDEQLHKELKAFVRRFDGYRWAEDPFLSLFTDSCTKRATDISEGGADYCNYGFTTVGMASVCDSLLNIRDLCFREKRYGLTEAERARERDFRSQDHHIDGFGERKGHFGHDEKDSIALTNHLIRRCNKAIGSCRNRLGGRIRFGLSSPDYILSGSRSEADFAGRKSGMPYATNISADDAGYTELVGFAGSLSYDGCCINGNVTDLIVQPDIIEENREKFALFLKGAIRRGFYQLQMNIIDSATLIEAKKDPEKHKNLIVRVWGFSAYFHDLPEEYQDRLIERALISEGRKA